MQLLVKFTFKAQFAKIFLSIDYSSLVTRLFDIDMNTSFSLVGKALTFLLITVKSKKRYKLPNIHKCETLAAPT